MVAMATVDQHYPEPGSNESSLKSRLQGPIAEGLEPGTSRSSGYPRAR